MARMGEGFRFRKVMAWSPAILILMGALNIGAGRTPEGALVALAGIVFGLVVKRRARHLEEESKPQAGFGAPPTKRPL